MLRPFFIACFFFSLFAQESISLTEDSNGALTIFPIDSSIRGEDLVAHFNILNTEPFKTRQSQIGLQTTKNGLIPNIQFITPMTNHTILLVAYLLPSFSIPRGNVGKDASGQSFGYIAVPVEQTTALIYSPTTMSLTSTYTSNPPRGTLSIFSMDLGQRAADLEQVVSLLVNPPIANSISTLSPVSIQMSLEGPFYTGGTSGNSSMSLIVNGLIPQVQGVSSTAAPNGSLLLITFKPPRPNQFTTKEGFGTVVVAPDQITQIIFTQN